MSMSGSLKRLLQRAYVRAMLTIVARALVAASRADPVLRGELAAFPRGCRVGMRVLGTGPSMTIESCGDGTFRRVAGAGARPDLAIGFKHLSHAFLVLSFQEGTALAFARDRMIADGDVALATRLVRCLNCLESVILPGVVARRAVKRHPRLPALEKLALATRIYAGVALGFVGAGGR